MAAHKYLYNNNGVPTERALNQTSAGAGDAGKGVALNGQGKIDDTMLPTGTGDETKQLEASEALSAGDWINIYDDAGTIKMRKADASAVGKKADGFVRAAVSMGASGKAYLSGINDQLSGLTGGSTYYLAATAGEETTTPPDSGNIVQELGRALSATEIMFQPQLVCVTAA